MNGSVQPGSMRLLSSQCSRTSPPNWSTSLAQGTRHGEGKPADLAQNPDHFRVTGHPSDHNRAEQILGKPLLPSINQAETLAELQRP